MARQRKQRNQWRGVAACGGIKRIMAAAAEKRRQSGEKQKMLKQHGVTASSYVTW